MISKFSHIACGMDATEAVPICVLGSDFTGFPLDQDFGTRFVSIDADK